MLVKKMKVSELSKAKRLLSWKAFRSRSWRRESRLKGECKLLLLLELLVAVAEEKAESGAWNERTSCSRVCSPLTLDSCQIFMLLSEAMLVSLVKSLLTATLRM